MGLKIGQEPRSKLLARCKNKFLMTTVQETTNIHKLIIFCFSVNDADNNLLSTLKDGTKLKAQVTGSKPKPRASGQEPKGKLSTH